MLSLALLPLGLGLAFDVTFAVQPAAGSGLAIGIGIGVGVTAIALWYVWAGIIRAPHGHVEGAEEGVIEMPSSPVESKIRHVLTEARMLLPARSLFSASSWGPASSHDFASCHGWDRRFTSRHLLHGARPQLRSWPEVARRRSSWWHGSG